MSNTNSIESQAIKPVDTPLNLRELTEALIKHYDLHEGKYDLLFEFQIGTGMFGPTLNNRSPAAVVGISKFGLVESVVETQNTVDASIVNPVKKKRSAKTKDA